MLDKLEQQMRMAVAHQKEGDYNAALVGYELITDALSFYDELGYKQEVSNIQRLALEAQPAPALTLYLHALLLCKGKYFICAAKTIDAAILLAPEISLFFMFQAKVRNLLGDFEGSLAAYERAQELSPSEPIIREARLTLSAEQELPGPDYNEWLKLFHDEMQPATYIEIGLGHGRSLALAGPGTRTIGIDPFQGSWERLNFVCPHAPATLFQLTSDDFFANHDLRKILCQESFDLCFIDGLHLFEQTLKDFINLERYARKDSVILIHDCLPIAPIVAERERSTGFWVGDVWRIIPCLKAFRPDLKIVTIPTKPSGLGVVTDLDSTSTVLSDNFEEIVRYYLTLNCPENFAQRSVVCSVGTVDEEYIKEQFGRNRGRRKAE